MPSRNKWLVYILAVGVFGILNTEMGIVGILPLLAAHYEVSVAQAGQLVSIFALVVAISGPVLPMLLSGVNRKKLMLLSLGAFVICNLISIFTTDFTVALLARAIPAVFHPIYCSLALTLAAASSANPVEARKAITTVMLGVSAGAVLGVPFTTFIASTASIELALTFFAVINGLAFLATLLYMPSLPVQHKLTYGAQLSVLRKPLVWLSIATIITMGAAVAGANSFVAEYLTEITSVSGKTLSVMLLLFGAASVLGNLIAGKLLLKHAMKTAICYPIATASLFIIWFFSGKFFIPMLIIMAICGILFSIGSNINQYLITSAASEAPDFANGLFLSCANWGISIGTAVGGMLLAGMGVEYSLWGGVVFFILSVILIGIRSYAYRLNQHTSN